MMPNREYIDAKDKFVGLYMVYVNDGKGYKDAGHTAEFNSEELESIFLADKMILVTSDGMFKATCKVGDAYTALNASGTGITVTATE